MTAHPTKDELSGFVLGTLPPESTDSVADHIEQCPPCHDTVCEFDAHKDTLLEGLRQGSAQPVDEVCRQAMEKAAAIAAPKSSESKPAEPTSPSIAEQPSGVGAPAKPVPSRAQFLAALRASNVIDAESWKSLEKLPGVVQAADAGALGRALIQCGALTRFQATLLYQNKPKGLLFGEYIVLDRIGAGGMGQVFKTRHRSMDRIVALKVLARSAVNSPDAVKRFQREVKAAAKLIHPNIVTAFDAGQQDGTHFLVMEYVAGSDLSNLIKQDGPLPADKAISYITQAARGLAFAHAKGVVHRDVKPANLLVDGEGTVRILDMGLARLDSDAAAHAAGEGLTQSGQVMGTVDYMAPEQAFDTSKADAKADVYGLGCTLYRLLSGEILYAGESLVQKLMAHREQPIPPLAAKCPQAPPQLDAIYQRMVAKQPADRPTMGEVVRALEALVSSDASAPGRLGGLPPVQVAAAKAKTALPKPLAGGSGGRGNKRRLIAAGAGGAFLCVALGAWIILRGPDGKEKARIEVPDGTSVTITNDPAAPASNTLLPVGEPGRRPIEGTPTPQSAAAPSGLAFDALRRADIDPYELKVAGGGDAANAPSQLVSIYGDSRLAMGELILGLAMFPDDQTIATLASSNYHSYLSVWDRESGRRKVSQALPMLGRDVAVSSDGTLLACAGQNMLKIWEYPLMREYRNLEGHGGAVIRAFGISPDNRWGVGVGNDIYIWDLKENRLVHRDSGKGCDKATIVFHPDNSVLAVVADNFTGNNIRLWELPSCKPLPELKGHASTVLAVAFSPDGKNLYAVDRDHNLLRWDWAAGKSHALVTEKGPNFDSVAVHPDGQTLATCDTRGEIVLWEAASGVKKRTLSTKYSIRGGNSSRSHLQFAKSGRFLVSSNPELTTVAFWPLVEGEKVFTDGHRELLRETVVTPDGEHLVTNSTDGIARVWNVATGKVERSFATAIPDLIPKNMALSFDGATLAIASKNRVRLWNLADGAELRSFEVNGGDRSLRYLLFSQDGNYLGVRFQEINVWDLRSGALRKLPVNGGNTRGWALSPDGQTAYVEKVGSEISSVRIADWTARQDWPPEKLNNSGTPTVTADGELIALHASGVTLLVEVSSGKVILKLPQAINVATARTGQRIAGVYLNRYWVWDRTSGLQEFVFPEDVILGYPTFSPDGRHLLTSNLNGTVYVLRLSDPPSSTIVPLEEGGRRPDENSLATITSKPPHPGPLPAGATVDDAWIKQVATLTPGKQLDAVSKKLQEINPGFDGKFTGVNGNGIPSIEMGMVTGVGFITDKVGDVSPIRAITGLKALGCTTSYHVRGKIADLSQLRGMKLTTLLLNDNQVEDLSPLTGMPLETLNVSGNSKLFDLSPLRGMPLANLSVRSTQVSDLFPLEGLPLTQFDCSFTPVFDLSSLKGMPLTDLNCGATQVKDLSPLKGLRLTRFHCSGAPVSNLSPIKGMPILELSIGNCKQIFDLSPLAGMPLENLQGPLTMITDWSPLKGLPLKQASFTRSKLTDLESLRGLPLENLDIAETAVADLSPLEGMKITVLRIADSRVADLSPLRGMPLGYLSCDHLPVADLTPLKGMPLGALFIAGTKVSDLSVLESCKPLGSVNAKGTPVTAEAVAKLKQSLPRCKIDWDDPAKATVPQPAAAGTK